MYSIDKVANEICAGQDDLSNWIQQDGRGNLFKTTDISVVEQLVKVSQWATSQKYEQVAVNTFLSAADFYIVGHAIAGEHTIVTHEKPANSSKRIKIPDACESFSIQVISPYEMLRIEKAKFILSKN